MASSKEEKLKAQVNKLKEEIKDNKWASRKTNEGIKALYRELEQEHNKAQLYLDIAGVIILALDRKGNVILVNQKGCKILGYRKDEILGKNWFDNFILEEHRNEVKKVFNGMILGHRKNVEYHENPVLTRKGGIRVIAWHNKLLKDSKGKGIGTLSSGEDITESSKTKKALEESEKKYRLLFENMNDAFALHEIVLNKKGKPVDYIFLDVNDMFEKATGLKKKNIIGKRVTEVLPGVEKDNVKWIQRYSKVALTGKNIIFEDYSEALGKWYSVSAYSPSKGKFAVNFRDVSKRRNTEIELQKAHDELEDRVKERTKELEFLSKTAMEFVEFPHKGDIYKYIGRGLFELTGENTLIGVSEINEEKEAMILRYVESSDRIMHYARKLYGDRIGSMEMNYGESPSGKHLKKNLPPGDLVRAKGGLYEISFGQVPKKMAEWAEKITNVKDIYGIGLRRGNKLLGVVTIITFNNKELENKELLKAFINQASVALERKRVEAELRDSYRFLEKRVKERTKDLELANKELMKMDKIEELDKMKDEFLSITTHELKTPLTPIKLQAEMMLKGTYGNLDEKQRQSLKTIIRNTTRLIHLIDDVMTIAKIDQRKLEFNMRWQDVGSVIRNMGSDMAMQAEEKGLYFRVELGDNLPKVKVDKNRMQQVIVDLINNSIKFTDHGGITVSAKKKGKNLLVSVKDTGIGIPKNELSNVFQRFYQVDQSITRRHSGTGLGLAISKNIIERHNGKIWVESTGLGEGSTFYFTIPISK